MAETRHVCLLRLSSNLFTSSISSKICSKSGKTCKNVSHLLIVFLVLHHHKILSPLSRDRILGRLLKACVAIFYQIFIFYQMIGLQKLRKIFFISSKKLFSFLRYLKFCIFILPSFFSCQPFL